MRTATAILALAAVLILACAAPAHAERNTLIPTGAARYQPDVFPDRIVLVATEDPARSQTVNWRTGPGVKAAEAQITVARDTPGLHLWARTVGGDTRPLTSENGLAHHHAVHFNGLEPDTLYAYRVRGQDTWSEWLQFRTAPAGFRPFSFLYFGDAQNSVKSHFSRVIRESWRSLPEAALMLHAGDLVNLREGIHDDEWGEWFEAGGFLHAMVPTMPVPGNHEHINVEYDDGSEEYRLSEHWKAQFAVPRNGPEGLQNTVYYVRYGDVLFVSLDSTIALQSPDKAAMQARWLDELLERQDSRWVFVSHHHPVFSVSMGRDNPELREHWQPVYERHGVDMVLQGHDHTYGRGTNVPEGATVIDPEGPVYVVSVSGPKMYLVDDDARETLQRTGEDAQLYQIIHVEADRLRFESRTAAGRLYDAFDLERTADGGRRLIQRLPDGLPDKRCGNPNLPRPTRCWEGKELID